MKPQLAVALSLFLCLALSAAGQAPASASEASPGTVPAAAPSLDDEDHAKLAFAEVWAYLMVGEERFLDASYPISDLAYFSAAIDNFGGLVGVPDRKRLGDWRGRVHLVVAELGNYSLTHFCLNPAYPIRDRLAADIALAAEPYDGVQLDFEAVSSKDYDAFFEFVSILKRKLGDKKLSLALGARMNERTDYFGYSRLAEVVDRIVVMAYDEHWSSSSPGPIASIDWCSKIADYARSKVGAEKLVMGNPFYGRAWADKSLTRAYKHSAISTLIAEKGIQKIERLGEVPFFEYDETVRVRAYFDDAASTAARLSMYRAAEIANIAFWRLGQEDPAIWTMIPAPGRALAEASRD